MAKARAAEPVFLFEADPTLLTTTVRIVFTVGTSSDPKGKGGVANLVSELLMRGTKKRNRSEFQTALERMGAAFDCSASHDKIIYSGEVIKENTTEFFKLIHEALTQPAFSKKEFEALKKEMGPDIEIKATPVTLASSIEMLQDGRIDMQCGSTTASFSCE